MDVTLSHTAPLYAGTGLTLTCTVTLDPNVDNDERVMTEWSGLQDIQEERYSVTCANSTYTDSTSTSLTISPLADQDDGTYTCTVTVTGGSNVQQATASDDVTIIAGQTYSLTCSVQVVAHLVVEPSIEWTRQDGTVLNASSGYSLQLNFNPLMTSNSSLYTCQASVEVTGVVESVSAEASRDLLLASMYII